MSEKYTIPAHGEHDHEFAQKETRVKLTIEVEGGTVPDDEVVVFTFPQVILTKPGQLELSIDRNEEFDWEYTWATGGHWEQQVLNLNIDNAPLRVGRNDLQRASRHDDPSYTIEVKKKETQDES